MLSYGRDDDDDDAAVDAAAASVSVYVSVYARFLFVCAYMYCI